MMINMPETKNGELCPWAEMNFDDADLQRLLDEPLAQHTTGLRENSQQPGFDSSCGESWIYPSNLPCRSYQLSISQACLYSNTLVVLPTGLGKTFIAAVVMYNIYRWYPKGKIIFMAPTCPLVAQQIKACARVMPFRINDTIELTGKIQRSKRAELWRTKRVFFATPQVVQSDIMANIDVSTSAECTDFPFDQIRLIVVDEAHKAKGRYAYTDVVQMIWQRNRCFRVLALSATPGRTMEDIAEVVRNLLISNLEVRWDSSIDVMPYIHQRKLETIVVTLGDEITSVTKELLQIIDPYLRQLIDADVLSGSLRNINRNFLVYEQKRFREHSLTHRHIQHSAVSTNFSICISLYHALELLERHGLWVFFNSFQDDEEGRAKFVLMDRGLRNLIGRLHASLGTNPFNISTQAMVNGVISPVPKDLNFGHPKFEKARDVLIQHFQECPESRAIVFCEYRDSVMLMYRLLLQNAPMLKPRCFVGQGVSNGPLRALTQKQQIQIMSDFRSGKSNILIATSIGEEGIDVGEVELIVCFDINTSNPQRFIQRIGRTGREKRGKVVMLVTEGREQNILKEVLVNKDQINMKLLRSSIVKTALCKHVPRMVPTEFNPRVVHTFIESPKEEETVSAKLTKKKITKVKQKKKGNVDELTGSQDLRRFFNKKSLNLSGENLDFACTQGMMISTPKATESTTNTKIQNSALKKIDKFFKKLDFSDIIATNTQLIKAEADPKHLRKLNKLLQSTTPIVPVSQQKLLLDFSLQLKSKQVSKEVKLLFLQTHPELLRQLYENSKILEVLKEEEYIMSAEEQKIRETFATIISLFYNAKDTDKNQTNEAKLEGFLKEAEYKMNKFNFFRNSAVEMNYEIVVSQDFDFQNATDKIFQGLETGDAFNVDNFDYMQQELKNTQRYQDVLAENELPTVTDTFVYQSMLEENNLNDPHMTDFSTTETKYCSQWVEFVKCDPTKKSTPLHTSTMKTLKKQHNNLQFSTFSEKLEEITNDNEGTEFELAEPTFKDSILDTNGNGTPTITTRRNDLESNINIPHTPQESKTEENIFIDNKWFTVKPFAKESTQQKTNSEEALLMNELDVDIEAFLEPFPEELLESRNVSTQIKSTSSNSQKENEYFNHLLDLSASLPRKSPDLFDDTASPNQTVNKIIDKTKTNSMTPKSTSKYLEKSLPRPMIVSSSNVAVSPHNRKFINSSTPQNEKSPSIFDMYMKTMRGRVRLNNTTLLNTVDKDSPANDSPIILRRKISKRKILASDSDSDTPKNEGDKETDCEEIAASQRTPKRRVVQNRKKRQHFCAFLEDEAAHSGTDASEDENDHTIGNYLLDSVVVSSDETTDDGVTPATQMEGIYLRSLKSPRSRSNTFKMPEFRVYNDHSKIFSQNVLPVEDSQYLPDSFVVENTEDNCEDADQSLCPLERAERILKERRREKRKMNKLNVVYSRKNKNN